MLATTVPTVTTTVVVEVVEDGETGADQDLEVGATTALVIARVTDPDPEIARNFTLCSFFMFVRIWLVKT